MYRFCESKINAWLDSGHGALLVSGARQVGKTYIIRKVLEDRKIPYFEINFIDRPDIAKALKETNDLNDFIKRLRLYSPVELPAKEGIIFFDEIQEFPEIVTKIKFLVDEGLFRYILSGSLLGVELKNIRSIPVGYYEELRMFPMNFLEFAKAYGISDAIIESLHQAYEKKEKVDSVIHEKMIELFTYYLLVGGMPRVVSTFLETSNLGKVDEEEKNIVNQYKADFSKYEADDKKLRLIAIYDNIPSQLNKQNLRFIFNYLNKELKFNRYENSFLWLKDAGVACPCYIANEIKTPLITSKEKNTFKLFMNDVGLLVSAFPFSFRREVLSSVKEEKLNNGSLFENFVMQELTSNGLSPYYYKSQKIGEIDFLVEMDDGIYALEVKSGKEFRKHKSLDNLMEQREYKIQKHIVLSPHNLFTEGGVDYIPIYMAGFINFGEGNELVVPPIIF